MLVPFILYFYFRYDPYMSKFYSSKKINSSIYKLPTSLILVAINI